NDGVVLLSAGRVVAKEVEGVGLDPVDFATVEGGVFVRDLQRGGGAVDSGNACALWSEVERKASLIAEDVERVSFRVPRGGGVVLALVEECPGLLAFEAVVV